MWQQLLDQKILLPLDLFFADLHHPATEEERAFFAAVMASSRAGHLCLDLHRIEIADQALQPQWQQVVLQGAKTAKPSPYVCCYQHLAYLEKNFTYESRILHHLKRLSTSVKPLDFRREGLTEEQQGAVQLALSHSLSIVEGGPGTGKTFLTSALVQAMGPSARVVLAAPTGKAAARLKQLNPGALCGTLHALLGIKSTRQGRRQGSYLQADLILIDESSMIDAKLLAFLLGALQVGQRVVFLGDGNQLPPVETGTLFGDLVDLLPTAHLKQCLRSDRFEIVGLARDILQSKAILPHHALSLDHLLQLADQYYPHPTVQEEPSAQFPPFCILSPVREGPWGVNPLNETIFHFFHRRMKYKEWLAVPILITRTDYEAELYNGEMGILWRTQEKAHHAFFQDEVKGWRKIPASALPPYELGYVLSVHKSQGSEFDTVAVVVPPGSELFGRELLYTAVTRAKREIFLYGDAETLHKTIALSSQRNSGLKLRWSAGDV